MNICHYIPNVQRISFSSIYQIHYVTIPDTVYSKYLHFYKNTSPLNTL